MVFMLIAIFINTILPENKHEYHGALSACLITYKYLSFKYKYTLLIVHM